MKPMQVAIREIGNSKGIVIPKPVLAQLDLDREAAMTIEDGAIVLRKPAKAVRVGWAQEAKAVAERGEDALVLGEFGNADDADLQW
ncbi:MAG: hypothetical protein LBQ20_08260 [Rhodanobacter sp.]|jgi:antitoxin MazE|nr:hypothetical protein [Rhodanobacter sp.]